MRGKYPVLEFDRLKMYFGDPYVIPCRHGSVTLPFLAIGDLVEAGETAFFSALNVVVANTTSYRAFLWDFGLDWNEVSDFELFCMIYKQISPEISGLFFGGLDLSRFEVTLRRDDGCPPKLVLVSAEQDVEIGEDEYQRFHQYYQILFNMKPEDELTYDSRLKKWWIDKDKRKQARKAKKREQGKEGKKFSLQPMISALVNHPGFKYRLGELKQVGIAEFYDSVRRLQIYEQSTALLKGMFSGMISSKDIDPDQYNWMKDTL